MVLLDMIKKIKKLTLFILLLNNVSLFSEEYILQDIQVNGLKRTRYNTILKVIDLQKGVSVDSSVEEKVKQDLLSSGIFQNDITVNLNVISENEAVLNIDILERWTLIPIPVGLVSTDSWIVGGVFIESNLLGLKQTLLVGTFVNSENIMGFSAWNNPAFLGSKYSFGLSTSYTNGTQTYVGISGDKTFASFDEKRFAFSLNVGRSLSTGFGWNIGTGLEWFELEDLSNSNFSDILMKNVISITWDNLYYTNFFNQGWSTKVKSSFLTSTEYFFNPSVEISLSRSIIFGVNNLFKLKLNAGWHDNTEYKPILIGGMEGSRVLPSGNIAVKKYSDGLISFEPVILNPSWGVFTIPVYYEAGIYDSNYSGYEHWHGPGFGFRFYVDKVAMPALGADFTWDLERGLFKVSVSIGGAGGGD